MEGHGCLTTPKVSSIGTPSRTKFAATHLWKTILRKFYYDMTLKSYKRQFRVYEDSFTGKDAVDFMTHILPSVPSIAANKCDRSVAFKLIKQFFQFHYFFNVKDSEDLTFYDNLTLYKFNDEKIKAFLDDSPGASSKHERKSTRRVSSLKSPSFEHYRENNLFLKEAIQNSKLGGQKSKEQKSYCAEVDNKETSTPISSGRLSKFVSSLSKSQDRLNRNPSLVGSVTLISKAKSIWASKPDNRSFRHFSSSDSDVGGKKFAELPKQSTAILRPLPLLRRSYRVPSTSGKSSIIANAVMSTSSSMETEPERNKIFCERINKQTYSEQSHSLDTYLMKLVDHILMNENLSPKGKFEKLQRFRSTYPNVYSKKFASTEEDPLTNGSLINSNVDKTPANSESTINAFMRRIRHLVT